MNVNSLTVVNLTTAGTVQIQTGTKDVTGSDGTVTQEPVYTTYDKNGGGIATNPAFPGTSITSTTAKDLSVTARPRQFPRETARESPDRSAAISF